MIPQGTAAAVTCGKRFFAVTCHIIKPGLRKVGNIHKDPKLVHPLQRLKSKRFQAFPGMCFMVSTVGKSDAVLIVPGKGNHPYAILVNCIKTFQTAIKLYCVFNRQDG